MKTIKVKYYSEIPTNFTGIVEYANGAKKWYKEGKYHRLDGPAIEQANGTKYWYIDGNRVTEEEFPKEVLEYKVKIVIEA